MSVRAVIGFGSNLGDGRRLVVSAWSRLAAQDKVIPIQLSSLYASEAVGMVSRYSFTNAVGLVETDCSPTELLHLLLAIEEEHGRRRDGDAVGYQDRSLDLDLLYFGEIVTSSPELTLPHPHIAARLFVLAPLAEIAPGLQDPRTGLTVREMARQLVMRIEQGIVPPQPIVRIEQVPQAALESENQGDATVQPSGKNIVDIGSNVKRA